jgi:peptidoglycan/LPS O-acetylase OafA/YrhL
MRQQRVSILDSFRFIAIMAVMFMHFTYRWTPPANPTNLYPYGNFFNGIFYYGYLGVQFFYIISGFVISYTLENTEGIAAFFKNRFIRLFPPMLLCTCITYFVAVTMDSNHYFENAHSLRNFLPSLTFTKPSLWVAYTGKDWSYISLSYWSLWVEVQFYVIAAILFYYNRKFFFRNLILVTIFISLANYIPDKFIDPASYPGSSRWARMILTRWYYNRLHFDIKQYLSWFAIGVVFHHLYKERGLRIKSLTGAGVVFIFLNQFYQCENIPIKVAYLIMLALFSCMVYRPKWLFFLDNPFYKRVGVISYTIYLIHEIIGVLLINKYGAYLGKWSPIAPFIVAAIIIAFAELSYRLYEKNAGKLLKRILFRPKVNKKPAKLAPVES